MFEILKLRFRLGSPAIARLRSAKPPRGYAGLPSIDAARCATCQSPGDCRASCPSGAILELEAGIDLGKCTFCRDCERACRPRAIAFGDFHRLAATSREALVLRYGAGDRSGPEGASLSEAYERQAVAARRELRSLFGRSLKLRQVSAGGCNACEMEMNAATNVNFDMGRFGIEWVASPRHADGLVLTGPMSENMADALEDAYDAMPEPKILIAAGACAISGGIFEASTCLDRSFLSRVRPDLYVPGCPPHPLTFIHGILDLLGIGGR